MLKSTTRNMKLRYVLLFFLSFVILFAPLSHAIESPVQSDIASSGGSATPWWIWPLVLFVVTFVLGILAVLGGVGGGVLFVPIIGGFFPFNIDFVRGAGLLVALAGALAAGPGLLKRNLASLRL